MSHLVIAGTGRAGTTFLVSWLAKRGADTGPLGEVDEHSGGGHEHRLTGADLPYVVKDPWLFTYLDRVDPAWIRVLVIPVRDLAGAAGSRVRVEREAIERRNPGWGSDKWGRTPGGMVHRITTEAQADVLAVGFYELVQWATVHDVPLVLLDFDRINDDDYLTEHLMEWLC